MSLGSLPWLFLGLATATPTPVATPSPQPTPAALSAPQQAAALVDRAKERADLELAVLDGGPLSQALRSAAQRGLPLRLLLDPSRESTRRAGARLGLKPGVQVRWLPGAGRPARVVLADGRSKAWRSGGRSAKLPKAWATAFEERFSAPEAPDAELQRLEEELKALPDPTEGEPRITGRRGPSDE